MPGCEYGLGKIEREWLLLAVGYITSFALFCFELLRILAQSKDEHLFFIPMKIHSMLLKKKK